MREAKSITHKFMCEGGAAHAQREGLNIKHGLVHHSFAAGPAARQILNQHLPG
jgi:hypothetical protein